MSEDENSEIPLEILPHLLSKEAIMGIIENFILRDGTDYGEVELSYKKKAQQIRRQIEKGDIKIVFDQSLETVSLHTDKDLKRLLKTRK